MPDATVVFNNFYQKFSLGGDKSETVDWSLQSSWGYTWISFFFMLSGFVLMHNQMTSDNPTSLPTQFDFLKRRLASMWPLFFASILLSAWNWPADRFPEKNRWWEVLASMSLLLHAWVPAKGYVLDSTFNQVHPCTSYSL